MGHNEKLFGTIKSRSLDGFHGYKLTNYDELDQKRKNEALDDAKSVLLSWAGSDLREKIDLQTICKETFFELGRLKRTPLDRTPLKVSWCGDHPPKAVFAGPAFSLSLISLFAVSCFLDKIKSDPNYLFVTDRHLELAAMWFKDGHDYTPPSEPLIARGMGFRL